MSLSLRVRASGIVAAVAFATVIGVVPAQAFALPPVPLIQGAISAAVVTGDEASLLTGPASPVVALAITSVGAILGATAPVWVPWVTSTIGNLTSGGNSPAPDIFTHAQGLSAPPASIPMLAPPALSLSSIRKDSSVHQRASIDVFTDGSVVASGEGMRALLHYRLTCQVDTTGAVYWKEGFFGDTLEAQNSAGQSVAGYPPSTTNNADCSASGDSPVALQVGPATVADCTSDGQCSATSIPRETTASGVSWVNPSPPTPPAGSAAAAAKVLTTNVHCVAPDGSTFDLSSDIDATAGGFTLPSCAASVAGAHALQMTVSSPHVPGDASPSNIYQITPKKNASYPGCDPTQPGPLCVLSLKVDGTTCVVGAAACQGWTSLLTTAPSRLECDWGTYNLPLSDCDVLERAFEPTGQPGTLANTDGDPSTWDGTDPSTDSTASPSPSASASATAGAGTGVDTGGTASTDPGLDPFPAGSPLPGPNAGGGECYPTGWAAFNPVEWVLKPVECALSWAFVPSVATVTDLQDGVANDVKRVGFGPIDDAVTAGLAPLGNSSGCAGPTFNFDFEGTHTSIQPLNACSGGMAVAAGVVYAFTTLVFIAGGGFVFLRAIGSAFGYNFSIGPRNTGDA